MNFKGNMDTDRLLKFAGSKMGMDPENLKRNIESGNFQNLNIPEDKKRQIAVRVAYLHSVKQCSFQSHLILETKCLGCHKDEKLVPVTAEVMFLGCSEMRIVYLCIWNVLVSWGC